MPNYVSFPVSRPGTRALPSQATIGADQVLETSTKKVLTSAERALFTTIQDRLLLMAAKNPDAIITGAITLSGDLVTAAAVIWPDGTPGTLTIISRDANSAVLSYAITYGSPATKTFTQPTITRTSTGAATNVPQIVIS